MKIDRFRAKRMFVVLISCLVMAETASSQPDDVYPLSKAKRILFVGNSITYAGGYVTFFECFYRKQYPASRAEIINAGLPSETVSGLSEPNHADGAFPRPLLFTRLASLLEKTRPDVVFACYGMNDGIYLPFDETRFEAYKNGMNRLWKDLKLAGARRIIFLTPPVHDDSVRGLNGYNRVLDRYALWLLEQRELQGWEVIDIHFPMNEHLIERRKAEPGYRLADDGVHPGKEGHWLMAREISASLNPKGDVPLDMDVFLNSSPQLTNLYEVIAKRQLIMKDAWLTYVGHERPGMKQGIPMKEARKVYKRMALEIAGIRR